MIAFLVLEGLMIGVFTALDLVLFYLCLLYTSDAADERSSVDLGGRRIIKKKNNVTMMGAADAHI